MSLMSDNRFLALGRERHRFEQTGDLSGIKPAMDAIILPILDWTNYCRTKIPHAVLATIIRDSSIAGQFDRIVRYRDQEDFGDIPAWLQSYDYFDQYQLTPFAKGDIRRNYKKLFGVELTGIQLRSCLVQLIQLELIVPVQNFYLINLPYIARALTGFKYEHSSKET